ncbi:MAG: hypothetical protein HZB29_06635 [Nitrospinae bacterium]|nr:hypothetical protein [Nitrospinota bacterium]
MKRRFAAVVVFTIAFAAGYSAAQSREDAARTIQANLLAAKERQEKRPTMDPALFSGDPYVESAYRAAKEFPEALDKMFCYCYCSINPDFKHKSLLTCYVDGHAAKCGVCMREGVLSKQMTAEGKTPAQIAKYFADFYQDKREH